ncbi:hypothetical protein EDC94DRAFT_619231 [Helicostylum pulchrum]|nr:hypothetical protein EDC94DRAFT_619231 [Helicostylum pulchrum]
MNFNQIPNSSFNDESWLYSSTPSELKSSYNNETLQEPVPFEDFKFSFGMNTDFSAAITDEFSPSIITDPFLQEPFTFMSAPNTVLDENDQKAFSSFLDAFFMDPEMQFPSNNNNNFYAFNNSSSNNNNNNNQEPSPQEENELEEKEEYRRSSILQSLDEQKMLHQRLSLIASLPTSPSITSDQCRLRSPSTNNTSSVTSEDDMPQSIYLRQSDSISSPYTNSNSNIKRTLQVTHEKSTTNKKPRTNKELLTEEEKRANHIASEQKRRSTIRNGFKDLTDLIPTLKNINNSKSTVLFKAVDFIKYLEKRTKTLKEKVGSLELRVEVEGRMTNNNTNYSNQPNDNNTIIITGEEEEEKEFKKEIIEKKKEIIKPLPKPIKKPTVNNLKNNQYNNNTYMNQTSHLQGLPANARNALLAHKTQQKQLLILQEQLQLHQRLIAQQQEMKERSMISVKNKLPPILGQYDTPSTKSFLLKELEDKSISAP